MMFMPRSPVKLVVGSIGSFTTGIPLCWTVLPRASTSSSKYPTYDISSPFAEVKESHPVVESSTVPFRWKCWLKKASVIVETSDPVSSRQAVSTPPGLTFTARQFPIAFSEILSRLTENLESEFSPPVGRLAATGGLSDNWNGWEALATPIPALFLLGQSLAICPGLSQEKHITPPESTLHQYPSLPPPLGTPLLLVISLRAAV